MPTVYFGTKDEPGFELEQSDDLIVVRTRSGRSITKAIWPVPTPLSAEPEDGTLVAAYPEAGVEVYRVPVSRGGRSLAARKTTLRSSSDVRFAGVLVDPPQLHLLEQTGSSLAHGTSRLASCAKAQAGRP